MAVFLYCMKFIEKLKTKWDEGKYLCIGLDPVMDKIPESVKGNDRFFKFNKQIIDATHDLVCAYKPNTAFYEAEGADGVAQLQKTTLYIKEKYPDIFILLDAKRADIGNTNEGSVKFAFDYLQADALTVHPYLGQEALKPFLRKNEKGIFVLCRTSNPGAEEFQDLESSSTYLYEKVAFQVANQWNMKDNVGLVVGATYPRELEKVRRIAKNIPILIPGVGAQGGDLEKTVKAAERNFIINSSRGIIFASDDEDFAEAARFEAEKLHTDIQKILGR